MATSRKTPDIYTASRNGDYTAETITYYRGTAKVYHPAPDGGSYEEYVTCTHKHIHPNDAAECGRKLGQREATRRTREATPGMLALPCVITQFPYRMGFGDPDQYLHGCTAHHQFHPALRPGPASAEADARAAGWTCPWAPFVTTR